MHAPSFACQEEITESHDWHRMCEVGGYWSNSATEKPPTSPAPMARLGHPELLNGGKLPGATSLEICGPQDHRKNTKYRLVTVNRGRSRALCLPAQSTYTALTSTLAFALRPVRIPPPPPNTVRCPGILLGSAARFALRDTNMTLELGWSSIRGPLRREQARDSVNWYLQTGRPGWSRGSRRLREDSERSEVPQRP